jgi:HAD superfamily hydrolase (TIGR01450 family)
MLERLGQIKHVALDLDGTCYKGGTLFDYTNPFLERMTQLGITRTFLTNNSSRSRDDYVEHLTAMGITATRDDIFVSTDATIEFLHTELPDVKRLFILGTPGIRNEFTDAGFTLTSDSPEDEPDAVIAGYDTTLAYEPMCRLAYWVSKGKPFFATNPDRVCPTDQPNVLVDCGSVCKAIEHATGRGPDAVLGKPDPRMLSGIMRRFDLQAHQLAMVGDRLYTDIRMARDAGALAVLVLTGEATRSDAETSEFKPDLIVDDLGQLGELIAAEMSK